MRTALLCLATVAAIAVCGIGIYSADAAGGRLAIDGYGVTAQLR